MKHLKYLGIFCALLFFRAGVLQAQPAGNGIYHIVATVCEDASTGVTVNYHCESGDSYVLYTPATDAAFTRPVKVSPVCRRWSTADIPNTFTPSTFYTHERFVCHATLSPLSPDTDYLFKIVAGGTESEVRSFRTAGTKEDWNFVAFTDFQHRLNPITLPLIGLIKAIAGNPPLMLCSGDMIDVAGDEEEWTWLLDSPVFKDFVYAASPGDHAYWANWKVNGTYPQYDFAYTFNNLFHFPGNGAPESKNTSYYFYYNNILFVALDMNNSDIASGPRFTDQAEWFDETITRLAGTYRYLVVFEHKSVFGSSLIDAAVGRALRPLWFPLFQKHRVDLVLSGHDHVYSRTYPLDGDRRAADASSGTYYLDMGSSGDKWRNPDESVREGDALHERVFDLKTDRLSCAADIQVHDTFMKVTVYNQYGQIMDGFIVPAKR